MAKGPGATRASSPATPNGSSIGSRSVFSSDVIQSLSEELRASISRRLFRRVDEIPMGSVILDGEPGIFELGNGLRAVVQHFSSVRRGEILITTDLERDTGESLNVPGYIDSYSVDGRLGTKSDAETEAKDHIKAMLRKLGYYV